MTKINLYSLAFLSFGVFACSHSSSDSSTVAPPAVEKPATITLSEPDKRVEADPFFEMPFVLNETYNGEGLTLLYTKKIDNWGEYKVTGTDAKALFTALKLKSKAEAGGTLTLPGQDPVTIDAVYDKIGRNVRCYGPQVGTADDDYSCSWYFNYNTGAVHDSTDAAKIDATVPTLKVEYIGGKIYLGVNKDLSYVFFSGRDAKALYDTLKISEVVASKNILGEFDVLNTKINGREIGGTITTKQGQQVACIEYDQLGSINKSNYTCMLNVTLDGKSNRWSTTH